MSPLEHHDGEHGDPASEPMAHRVAALVARLEVAGILSDAELGAVVERFLVAAGPANGAKLVAKAWTDPDFKALLLADADTALAESAMDMSHWAPVRLQVVENSASVHNVIVCTLCSCYPIALLGPSPGWYKSEAYRSRVVREPRSVLAEFGLHVDVGIEIRVWDSTAELRYIVLPRRPAGTDGWSEDKLATLVSRDALIGVDVPAVRESAN